jgi:hypothetical protein
LGRKPSDGRTCTRRALRRRVGSGGCGPC